jgi:hypothetical protein
MNLPKIAPRLPQQRQWQHSFVEVFNSAASFLILRAGFSGIDEARWGLNSGKGLGTGWLVTIVEGKRWAISHETSFVNA